MSDSPKPKLHIVNLTNLLNMFQPVLDPTLVNERNPHGWTGIYEVKAGVKDAPNRDQILNTAYAAMGDIKEFIKEHEQAKKDLADLREDALGVHKILMASGISTPAMEEGVAIILNRFKQSLDVIVKAATVKPDRLNGFQEDARQFVLRFTAPEKRDSIFGQPSKAPSILQSKIKPEGDAGANPNSGK